MTWLSRLSCISRGSLVDELLVFHVEYMKGRFNQYATTEVKQRQKRASMEPNHWTTCDCSAKCQRCYLISQLPQQYNSSGQPPAREQTEEALKSH